MKIDMRLNTKTETDTLGQSGYTLVYTDALSGATLAVRVSKAEFEAAVLGTHRDVTLDDTSVSGGGRGSVEDAFGPPLKPGDPIPPEQK